MMRLPSGDNAHVKNWRETEKDAKFTHIETDDEDSKRGSRDCLGPALGDQKGCKITLVSRL